MTEEKQPENWEYLPITSRGFSLDEIRKDPQIPEEIKNLILPIAFRLLQAEVNLVGVIELAYRRGVQAGQEELKEGTDG